MSRKDGARGRFTPDGFTCIRPDVRRSASYGTQHAQPGRNHCPTFHHPTATHQGAAVCGTLAPDHSGARSGCGLSIGLQSPSPTVNTQVSTHASKGSAKLDVNTRRRSRQKRPPEVAILQRGRAAGLVDAAAVRVECGRLIRVRPQHLRPYVETAVVAVAGEPARSDLGQLCARLRRQSSFAGTAAVRRSAKRHVLPRTGEG